MGATEILRSKEIPYFFGRKAYVSSAFPLGRFCNISADSVEFTVCGGDKMSSRKTCLLQIWLPSRHDVGPTGIRRREISFLLAARTTTIGDDDRANGKLTTRGARPPSRRIGLRKYCGKLNLFCIETGISGKNALSSDARSCRGCDVIHRKRVPRITGVPPRISGDECTSLLALASPPSLSTAPRTNGAKSMVRNPC
jgi:hypothetical protein